MIITTGRDEEEEQPERSRRRPRRRDQAAPPRRPARPGAEAFSPARARRPPLGLDDLGDVEPCAAGPQAPRSWTSSSFQESRDAASFSIRGTREALARDLCEQPLASGREVELDEVAEVLDEDDLCQDLIGPLAGGALLDLHGRGPNGDHGRRADFCFDPRREPANLRRPRSRPMIPSPSRLATVPWKMLLSPMKVATSRCPGVVEIV